MKELCTSLKNNRITSQGWPVWNALSLIRLVLFQLQIVSLSLTVGERYTFILKEISICMMHKAGKLEEKKKKKIPSVLVALRDAITFLRQLPISSAAESMYSPVWSCVLLMTDHDTSLILLLGALYSFESTLNITGKNLIPLTSSSFCSGDKKKSKVALGKLSQLSSTEMQISASPHSLGTWPAFF